MDRPNATTGVKRGLTRLKKHGPVLPDRSKVGIRGRSDVDALDFYALWKSGDALLGAAFRGTNRKYALGNTNAQRFMGRWPDNVAVKKMTVQ